MITAYTLIYTSLLIIPGCLQLADANTSLLLGPVGRVEGVLSGFTPHPFLLHLCSRTKKRGSGALLAASQSSPEQRLTAEM